jgi:AraC-like DNA-binding protein
MLTSNVEVLWTARYDYEPGWTLAPHQHDFFQMIYCLGGDGTLAVSGEEHALAPGSLFLIAPGRPHGLTPGTAKKQQGTVRTLDIKFRVNDTRLQRALVWLPPVWRQADETVVHLLERIRFEGEQRQPFFRELCATSLVEILITLVRSANRAYGAIPGKRYAADLPAGSLPDVIARRAVSYLHEHFAEELTIKKVSRILGVSERHLRTKLEEALGQTPHRYLAEYRIDRAKDLIAHQELALKDIATRTGFKTVHHFTRTFTQLAGISPGAWRRLHADGIRRDVCISPKFVNDLSVVLTSPVSDKPAAVSDKDAVLPTL